MFTGTWQINRELQAVAEALSITKPIPYTANGVWEATVQNVADAYDLALGSATREGFLELAGVETPRETNHASAIIAEKTALQNGTPDLLDNLITEGQYSPWEPYEQPTNPEGYR